MFRPAEGENVVENYTRFIANVTKTTVDHVLKAPSGMLNAFRRVGLGGIIYPYNDELDKFLQDSRKVFDREVERLRGPRVEIKIENPDADVVVDRK
jgi:hypothetical protein